MNQNQSKKTVVSFASPIYRALSGGRNSGQKGLAHEEGIRSLIQNSGSSATYIASPANPMAKVVAKPSYTDAVSMYQDKMARAEKSQTFQSGMLKVKQQNIK